MGPGNGSSILPSFIVIQSSQDMKSPSEKHCIRGVAIQMKEHWFRPVVSSSRLYNSVCNRRVASILAKLTVRTSHMCNMCMHLCVCVEQGKRLLFLLPLFLFSPSLFPPLFIFSRQEFDAKPIYKVQLWGHENFAAHNWQFYVPGTPRAFMLFLLFLPCRVS